MRCLYALVVGALRVSSVAVAAISGRLPSAGARKLAEGLRGRRGAARRLATMPRNPARPLVWFHAPSVGESQQACEVIEALLRIRPEVQVAFTHFSPSATGIARQMSADAADYLPWDLSSVVRPVLNTIAPNLIVFTRTEVWPTLAREASARGTPTALIAATVPEGAGRMRRSARRLLGPAWRGLATACAVGQQDADRLERLGVPEGRIRVTGDPAVAGAIARVADTDPEAPYLVALPCRPTIVAGSTWPVDEKVLVQAMRSVAEDLPKLLTIVAPHEPSPSRVRGIVRRFTRMGIRAATLTEAEATNSSLNPVSTVVVDRLGILAHLYTRGTVAYVGGGFGKRGLHSVVEPAAAGLPTVFGPRHERAPAAAELIERGAGFSIDRPDGLATVLHQLLTEDLVRERASRAGLDFIAAERGAAERTARLLSGLLRS